MTRTFLSAGCARFRFDLAPRALREVGAENYAPSDIKFSCALGSNRPGAVSCSVSRATTGRGRDPFRSQP